MVVSAPVPIELRPDVEPREFAGEPLADAPIPLLDLGAYHRAIRAELLDAISGVIDSSAFVLSEAVTRFEREFAEYCGASHAVGVGSGTEALSIALAALGLGPGDEVITAANTFIATAEAIALVGATPVFADVDERTATIDVASAERAITSRTRAIIPVHLYGRPAAMSEIERLARMYDLRVIEDAAQAHGARYLGQRTGVLGDVACFSFYPGKNLGALGDGGAIVTNDAELALRVRELGNHGGTKKYDHRRLGTTSRLDALQAAVLSVKLPHLDARNARRRDIAARYNELFEGEPWIATPPLDTPDAQQVFHLYVLRVPPELRDRLAAHLAGEGISTGIHYPTPVHLTPAFAHLEYGAGAFPVAEALADESISLPMYPEMTDAQVERVPYAVRSFLARTRHEGVAR